MNSDSDQIEKQFRTIKIIALALLVAAPIVYLVVAQIISRDCEPKAGQDMMVYLLLMVGIASPAVVPILVRAQIKTYQASKNTKMTPMNLFFTTSIMSMAVVEAVYVYGLIAFLLTGELVNMLYFYPAGIVWSLVYWPKREKYDKLIGKLSRP